MKLLKSRWDRFSGPIVRPLTNDDLDSLWAMIEAQPVTHVFASDHLRRLGLPAAGFLTWGRAASPFLGVFEPDGAHTRLTGALWVGVNIAPIFLAENHYGPVADYLARTGKEFSSLFGPSDRVLPLWDKLRNYGYQPFDVRPHQPLLVLNPEAESVKHSNSTLAEAGISSVRWAAPRDIEVLIPASVSMFTEEVGYSPLDRDPDGYIQRVTETVREGRSVLALDRHGAVAFKVDIGIAAGNICQLQGVWLAPEYRGEGFSAPLFWQACELIRAQYSCVSLYVNDYNAPARALYARVGFTQVDTFATVLF